MSNQIKPVLVSDPLLMLEDSINFAVYRGGQNVSVQKFPATSATSTAQQYQIQVPSLSTVIDRAIIWGSDITFTLQGTPSQLNDRLVNYGYTDVVAPFPLNNLCTNMNIQINNTSVSLPVNQVLDPLLRSIDSESIALWQGSTPTQLDYWGDYNDIDTLYEAADSSTQNSSPFNGYAATFNRREPPRGAFPVVVTGNTAQVDPPVLKTVTVTISVREPLFVSPFIYESPEGHSGMSGVTQINITAQMDALAKRAYRFFIAASSPLVDDTEKVITSVTYANSYMECKFLTAKPSDLIPSTIITPMYNLQNYITPANNGPVVGPVYSTTLTSNSIQINSIPDKVFVFVRQAQATLTPQTPDVYFAIDNVKITFGNQSGILSNFTVEDLHRASLLAGSKQTYLDFIGEAINSPRNATEVEDVVSTCGSVLCLNFGETINIPEDYFAPGSLSTTQFQITLDVTWKGSNSLPAIPELNCMFMTSGVFSCNNGSSASYTSGVLSKQVVLDANAGEPVNKAELSRLVGGGLMSSLKSMAHSLMPKLHRVVKQHGQNAANALLHEAVSAVGLAPVKRHRLKRM